MKAEMLARESLRIRTRLYDNDAQYVRNFVALLAQTLSSQNKKGKERQELFARSVAITKKYYGPEGFNTAATNDNMGHFYCVLATEEPLGETRICYLRQAEVNYKESLRIYTKLFGPNNPKTTQAAFMYFIISLKKSSA